MDEGALVWKRAPWCGEERPDVEDSVIGWRRVPWCGGGRPGVEESALVWKRMPLQGRGDRMDIVRSPRTERHNLASKQIQIRHYNPSTHRPPHQPGSRHCRFTAEIYVYCTRVP